MKFALFRVAAAVVLSGQVVSSALPFLCDRLRGDSPSGCAQQMAARHAGAVVAARVDATQCANAALCTTPWTPALTRTAPIVASTRCTHLVGFGVVTIASGDPQPPLPPPPQA